MKKLIFILFGFILFSCSTKNEPAILDDDVVSLTLKNLLLQGKVKEYTLYKLDCLHYENDKNQSPIIVSKAVFSNFGKLLSSEYYNSHGKLIKTSHCEYNRFKQKIKEVENDLERNIEYVEIIEYDNKSKNITISHRNKYNKTKFCYSYNHYKDVVKIITYNSNDTTISLFNYKYDSTGKVLEMESQDQNNSELEFLYNQKYYYNSNSKQIILNRAGGGKLTQTFKYKDDKILKSLTNYRNDNLSQEKFFDQYSNPVLIKNYSDQGLKDIVKFEYRYDQQNNWIEKKEYIKDYKKEENKFSLSSIETRMIKYYK